ncbi:MAG: DUF2058 family protein [Myxococcales bacterium]|nr:DUF2058 family protein [Myxococcales bacterium]
MASRKSNTRSPKGKGRSGGGGSSSKGGGLTLDFASKLAAAGLVSKDEAEAAAAQKRAQKPAERPTQAPASPRPAASKPAGPGGLAGDIERLKRAGKAERYETVRQWVTRRRLDAASPIPGEHSEPFHFTTAQGQLARLYLEADARGQVIDGQAGIIAYMSNHGIAHAVLPRELAEAIYQVIPLWLRVLKDHPGAGKYEEKPEATDAPGDP